MRIKQSIFNFEYRNKSRNLLPWQNVKNSLVFCLAIFLLLSIQASATVDPSWAWCPDNVTDNTLTYCFDDSINASFGTYINDSAKQWSDKTKWTIKPNNPGNIKDCNGANIKFSQKSGLGDSTGETHPHFNYFIAADKEGKCIRCLERVDIVFNKDIVWSTNKTKVDLNDPIKTALHETGHAIMLDHGGPNDKGVITDVMYHENTHLQTISAHDIEEANESAELDIYSISQLHKPVGPDGIILTYANFDLDIPSGALTDTVSIGIHPTSLYSTPHPAALPSGVDRLIIAAQIGIDNDISSVALQVPATITVHYNDSDVLDNMRLIDSELGVDQIVNPLEESPIKAYSFDTTTSTWQLIPESVVNIHSNTVTFQVRELGTFCDSTAFFAIGGEEKLPYDFPTASPIITASVLGIAGIAFLFMTRKQE